MTCSGAKEMHLSRQMKVDGISLALQLLHRSDDLEEHTTCRRHYCAARLPRCTHPRSRIQPRGGRGRRRTDTTGGGLASSCSGCSQPAALSPRVTFSRDPETCSRRRHHFGGILRRMLVCFRSYTMSEAETQGVGVEHGVNIPSGKSGGQQQWIWRCRTFTTKIVVQSPFCRLQGTYVVMDDAINQTPFPTLTLD